MSECTANEKTAFTPDEVASFRRLPGKIATAFQRCGDKRRFFICSDIQRYLDAGALVPVHARTLRRSAERLPQDYARLAEKAVTFEKWFNENYDLYKEGKL